MDYKIVLMRDAEEDIDRFITYLLFEKKSEQAARYLLNDFLCFIVLKTILFMWIIFFINCKIMKIK